MIECPRCASRNHVDDAFCGSCGMYLAWAESARPSRNPSRWRSPSRSRPNTAVAEPQPGSEFHAVTTAVPDSHGRVCSSCSRTSPWERRFCARCGTRLIHGDDIVRPTHQFTQVVIAPVVAADRLLALATR